MRYLTLVLAISSASALVVRHPYSPSLRRLQARQASVIDPDAVPDQCTQQCTPVLTDTQNCATNDNTCICKAQVSTDYQSCVNCISNAAQDNPTLAQVAQAAVGVFNMACTQAGISVASVTVPAFGAPGSAPTSSGQPPAGPPTPGANPPASPSGPPSSGSPTSGGITTPSVAPGSGGVSIGPSNGAATALPSASNSVGGIPSAAGTTSVSAAPPAGNTSAPPVAPANSNEGYQIHMESTGMVIIMAAVLASLI